MTTIRNPDDRLPPGELTEKERFIAAIRRGLAEAEAGLGVDDEELGDDLNAALDRRFGPLDSVERKTKR